METLVFILEIIGTIAFAASGAMTGINKKMDIFGVCILGLTVAVGGGVIRDVILGNTPPNTFRTRIKSITPLSGESFRPESITTSSIQSRRR